MDTAKFKRNVVRTVTPKVTQAGLRKIARKPTDANMFQAIVGLNTEMGSLIRELQPYLLGFQLNEGLLQASFTSFGGVGYFAVLLARTLKAKVPGSGKKIHLHQMTKTEALLALNNLSGDLMYHAMGALRGESPDLNTLKALVEDFLNTMWPLVYDLLGLTPGVVFEDYAGRLAAGLPAGLFSDNEEEYKQAAEAMKAMEKEQLEAINPPKQESPAPETVPY